jgi:hypothetical protein
MERVKSVEGVVEHLYDGENRGVNESPQIVTESTRMETYIVPYNCIYSLPIRMPGMTLSIHSSRPSFQITLKGGCDENGVFEMPKESNVWKISTLNYALGRLAYDIIWEEGLVGSDPLKIQTLYSTIESDEERSEYKLVSKTWQFEMVPCRWLFIPKSKNLLKKIQLKWQRLKSTSTPNSSSSSMTSPSQLGPLESPPTCEFRLAVATIPLKLFPIFSINQVLDLATIQSHILHDGKLNFSQVFGAWLVFDKNVDWSQWTTSLTYLVESN